MYQVFTSGRRNPMCFERLSTAVYYRGVIREAGRAAHIVVAPDSPLNIAA